MVRIKASRMVPWRALGAVLLVCAVGVFGAARAHAHFVLVAPDSWMSQDALGLPEKLSSFSCCALNFSKAARYASFVAAPPTVRRVAASCERKSPGSMSTMRMP